MYRMMCCHRMKRSNRSKWKHPNTINVHDERKKWMFAVVMMLNKYIDVNSSSKPHNFFSIIFVIIWLKVTHRNHEWTWETTATSSTKYCEREKNLSFILIFLVTRHLDGDSVFFSSFLWTFFWNFVSYCCISFPHWQISFILRIPESINQIGWHETYATQNLEVSHFLCVRLPLKSHSSDMSTAQRLYWHTLTK